MKSANGPGETSILRRVAAASIGAHLLFGLGIATVELQPLVTPGVWAVEEAPPVEVILSMEAPVFSKTAPPPVRQASPVPAGMKKGMRSAKVEAGKKSGGGGGDPLRRVTRLGVLGRLATASSGSRVTAERKGTLYASDGMTQLLRGVGETRRVTGPASKGESGIGFGSGVGSGFGGGTAKQEAEELVASLGDGSGEKLVLERREGVIDGTGFSFEGADGCRDETEIARIVLSHKGGIRGCYNRTLRRTPGGKGEIAVRFLISTGGDVTGAEVISSTVGDPGLEECVLERIGKWTFPAEPDCETVVRYSFHFTSDL